MTKTLKACFSSKTPGRVFSIFAISSSVKPLADSESELMNGAPFRLDVPTM